jgi:hypothetical protein
LLEMPPAATHVTLVFFNRKVLLLDVDRAPSRAVHLGCAALSAAILPIAFASGVATLRRVGCGLQQWITTNSASSLACMDTTGRIVRVCDAAVVTAWCVTRGSGCRCVLRTATPAVLDVTEGMSGFSGPLGVILFVGLAIFSKPRAVGRALQPPPALWGQDRPCATKHTTLRALSVNRLETTGPLRGLDRIAPFGACMMPWIRLGVFHWWFGSRLWRTRL